MYELFIREHYGDHNLREKFQAIGEAGNRINKIREAGGYWVTDERKPDRMIFIPWHSVEYASVEKES